MSKLIKKYPFLGSSVNPENISLTFKGIALALVPLFIIILQGFNIEVAENDLISLIESITGVIAGVMVVFGLFRKLFARKINQ